MNRLLIVAMALAGAGPAPLAGQETANLFASTEPLALEIRADFTALRGDRSSSPDRPALYLAGVGASAVELEGEIRTRGNFRLDPANCSFPPLRIEVDAEAAEGTVLEGIDDTKLVSSCRPGRATYDELVTVEYLAYRTLALVTDAAFQVRRLDLTFVDTSGGDTESRPAFVIEEDDALAERFGMTVFSLEEGKNLPVEAFDPRSLITNAVFQYMIGNTDWSAVAGHNVEILDRGGAAVVVPYDFDSSGLVNAPYATFDPDLGLRDVRERLYRGRCTNDFISGVVLEDFRAVLHATLELWSSEPNLSDGTRRRVLRYLEGFYDDIETDERAARRLFRNCR